MSNINWGCVFLGGLLAGLIVNATEILWSGIFLGSQWRAAIAATGRPLPPGAVWISMVDGFGMGIAAVWLYAAVRTRFGPGPRTAILAGVAIWVIGYALPALGLAQTGIFPVRLLLVSNLGGLGEIVLATLVGASFYKE